MRRTRTLALSVAASSLSVVPTASAHDPATAAPAESCPAPEVTYHYDDTGFFADATLVATGCPAREQRVVWRSPRCAVRPG